MNSNVVVANAGDSQFDSHVKDGMFRLRNRGFHGNLGWEVESRNGNEFDRYDGMNPVYVLAHNRHREVEGITSPIIMRQTPEAADPDAAMSPVLVGIFERSSHESTLLGCNLVGMETGQGERGRFSPDEILLEYHVPCAAGNGR